MHTLSATGTTTKNRLASADAWLILVKIDATVPVGAETYIYRTSDESITLWNSMGFSPMALDFGTVQENLQGGLPRIDMRISSLDTVLNTYVNGYDGLRGATVTVYVVPSGNLAANVAELMEVFEIIETSMDDQWTTFTLGYADPLGRRFPRDKYTPSACRHVYNGHPTEGLGPFCRLSNNHPLYATECDHTLAHCQLRSNEAQFGGSPGIDEGTYQ